MKNPAPIPLLKEKRERNKVVHQKFRRAISGWKKQGKREFSANEISCIVDMTTSRAAMFLRQYDNIQHNGNRQKGMWVIL